MAKVPNVIHFIYPVWANTRPLSYMNYIAIKRAKEIHKPDQIKLWINDAPAPSPYWAEIEKMVDLYYADMGQEFQGVQIEYPQLRSDVTRLQILHREGGIYMDTDMLLLRDLNDYMDTNFSMCLEPSGTGNQSACNALMIAEPGAEFAAMWLDEMAEALQNPMWAYGGVVLPYKLSQERPDLVMMHGHEHFCPFGLERNWLFATDPWLIEQAEQLTANSTAVHGFETFWKSANLSVSPEWCEKNDCLFSRLALGNR